MVRLATLWAGMQLFREPLILLCMLAGPAVAARLAAAAERR